MLLCHQPWVTCLAALIILLGMLGDPGKSSGFPVFLPVNWGCGSPRKCIHTVFLLFFNFLQISRFWLSLEGWEVGGRFKREGTNSC